MNDDITSMNHSGSSDDPLRSTFVAWSASSARVESLVHLTHEGFQQLATTVPEVLKILEVNEDRQDRADWIASQARTEIDAGFPIVHSSMLMVLWSLLETFVDDLVIAALAADRSQMAGESFKRVAVPAATLLASPDEQARLLMAEWRRESRIPLQDGVGRFEPLLNIVGLAGPVPRQLRQAIFDAQQIRNVWAHRAGIADARFVEKAPHLGFDVGDQVALPMGEFGRLMHGTHMYVLLIHGRYEARRGRVPRVGECAGFEGVLSDVDFLVGSPSSDAQ